MSYLPHKSHAAAYEHLAGMGASGYRLWAATGGRVPREQPCEVEEGFLGCSSLPYRGAAGEALAVLVGPGTDGRIVAWAD